MKLISKNLRSLLAMRFSEHKQVQVNTVKRAYDLDKIQQQAFVQYRKYPFLPHQDPHSKDYVASELDEAREATEVQAFNKIIDQLKHDIKTQREVWNAIDRLDRTYKKGTPGIHTNLLSTVATPKLDDLGFARRSDSAENHGVFKNEDSFIANTPYEINWKPSHVKQWEEQVRNRPVTKHFHHDKGYKYDVPVKAEEKYQFYADRLGHPEFLGTPFERLLKLENDIYHPEYIDQPFVKTPPSRPHESLNFEEGEVIYQNTRVLQWIKFWQSAIFTFVGYAFLFVPYQCVFKTHMVTNMASQLTFLAYHNVSPFCVDTLKLGVPIICGVIAYLTHITLNLTNFITNHYVIKMSYSKDKQLIFVTRVDHHGFTYQQVYETAHLQILPPNIKSGVADLSSQQEDGIWNVTCLNKQEQLLLYGNKNYWNPQLRNQFLRKTTTLWDKSYVGYNRAESYQKDSKWEQQLIKSLNQKSLPN